jgi:hypothetical protein
MAASRMDCQGHVSGQQHTRKQESQSDACGYTH